MPKQLIGKLTSASRVYLLGIKNKNLIPWTTSHETSFDLDIALNLANVLVGHLWQSDREHTIIDRS